MDQPIEDLAEPATAAAKRLLEAETVTLVSHIDADGLTSAGVASTALERASLPFRTHFSKQLDTPQIDGLAATNPDLVLFTDFGSGQIEAIQRHVDAGTFEAIIVDHHQPGDGDIEHHLNPLLVGINGASELSGAGTAYVLARALAAETGDVPMDNRDLAALAVVGAVGDMQASSGGLHGANAEIVAEGQAAGVLAEETDLALYGRQTRPLPKLLEYSSDIRIPGISNSERGSLKFLNGLGLDLKDDEDNWRRWVDLTGEERQTIASSLLKHAIGRGVPPRKIDSLVGTTYVLSEEAIGTPLRDASEFSTLLNATARYERADVGLAVCLGDRSGALDRAKRLLANHRRNLSSGLEWVKQNGVTSEANLQWFHAEAQIKDTIVGIVAGMALGTDGVDRSRPIIAFARKEDEPDVVKVSARGSHALVRAGLDLSIVMQQASRAVGGDGGGHDVAAGASIPAGSEAEFVEKADRIVGDQLDGE